MHCVELVKRSGWLAVGTKVDGYVGGGRSWNTFMHLGFVAFAGAARKRTCTCTGLQTGALDSDGGDLGALAAVVLFDTTNNTSGSRLGRSQVASREALSSSCHVELFRRHGSCSRLSSLARYTLQPLVTDAPKHVASRESTAGNSANVLIGLVPSMSTIMLH